ncbi:MAG: sigma-70 family RNA polymerase sigma factor [Planctomycetia bacterium]|nr:sigma-70 family RNA polymerase sigma factor [Planctomycetia bacterium]
MKVSAGRDEAAAASAAAFVAAQAGEAWALRVLYDDLAPRVAGYLRARGAAEPDDLTSEVFLAVFGRLGTVTGGYDGLRTLVFSVAHARLVDSLRARARRPDPVPYEPDRDRRAAASAEDRALVSLGAERAAALLAALPASQRDVLVLRVLGDLTVEQVAEALGTTEGAVKQLQRRGLIALRALVAAGGVTL